MKDPEKYTDQADILFNTLNVYPGCPLCYLLTGFEFKVLAKIQYDVINDETARNKISGEGGFCNSHFRKFKSISNYKSVLLYTKSVLKAVSDLTFNDFKCSLCESIKIYENELLTAQFELLNNKEYKNIYAEKIGMCIEHIKLLTGKFKDENITNWLLSVNEKQLVNICLDIDEMTGVKSYYEIDLNKRKSIELYVEKILGFRNRN